MSGSGIGVNSTEEILKELRTFTKEIRDLLLQKAAQESTQGLNGTARQREDSSPGAEDPDQTPVNTLQARVVTSKKRKRKNWPNDETIAKYKDRCAEYLSECKKMQAELGYFISQLVIVGSDKVVVESAELLQRGLLAPVQLLEKAFDVSPSGRLNAMREVTDSFFRLSELIDGFAQSPHQKDALYPDKVKQWQSLTYNRYEETRDLVNDGELVECLKFIHDGLFSELEMVMGDLIEALTTFEVKSASDWFATQKIGDIEKRCSEYISSVFQTVELDSTSAWVDPVEIAQFKERAMKYRLSCNEMREELDHLIAHYGVIGGDKEVIREARSLQDNLLGPSMCLERLLNSSLDGRRKAMISAVVSLGNVCYHVINFQKSLHHQKHAFYFRKLRKWASCLWIGFLKIVGLLRESEIVEGVKYLCNDLFSDFEEAMIGASKASKNLQHNRAITVSGSVAGELTTFGKESLPKFLVDQMERDTTRYVNLTTIATFFSSVTATTLQFTYAETDAVPSNPLRGVVNLFWFLSLVFSVSSGVSSLLGLTWRRSSIYDSLVPPMLIGMWFDKAPMLFLIIAAVSFVIGLNLFAYLSLQPRYVSLATNILTGMHSMCLLTVTLWFIYKLKYDSIWAKWIRRGVIDLPIWRWIRHPQRKYRENKSHLQRNFFWAFGIDDRVAYLNLVLNWDPDRLEPYLLSKLIRCIARPIIKCWLSTKKAFSCESSRSLRTEGDIESGEGENRKKAGGLEEIPAESTAGDIESGEGEKRKKAGGLEEIPAESPTKKAENEFVKALQTVFSNADWIMSNIESWKSEIMESEEDADHYIGNILWGYPDLKKKFHEVVLHAWIDESEKGRREIEEEPQQQEPLTELADNNPPHLVSEVAGQDKNDTASSPLKSSQPAPPANGSENLDSTEIVVKHINPGQPDDRPHPPDEHPPFTATQNTLYSTPVDPDTLSGVPAIGKGATAPNETEEVASITESEKKESRIMQSKEESGE